MKHARTLEEAIEVVKSKTRIQEDETEMQFVVRYHRTLGRKIKNEWGFWGGGDLRTELAQLGFTHADDMSSAIFQCVYRDAKGLDRDIPSIVNKYKKYWAKMSGHNLDDPSDKSRGPIHEESEE